MLLGNNVVSEVRWARWSPQKNLSVSLLFYFVSCCVLLFFLRGALVLPCCCACFGFYFCWFVCWWLYSLLCFLCVCFLFFAGVLCWIFCWCACLWLSVLRACCCFCVLVLDCADLLCGEKRWEKWWLTIIYTWILRIVEISTPKPKSINFAKIKEKRTPERLFPLLNGFFHTKAHFEPFFDLQIACVFDQKRN